MEQRDVGVLGAMLLVLFVVYLVLVWSTPSSASVVVTLPPLHQRHLLRYTWDGSEDREDAEVLVDLHRIDMPEDYPCRTLLLCVHEVGVLLHAMEWADGVLVVGTGTGKSAVVRYMNFSSDDVWWRLGNVSVEDCSECIVWHMAKRLVRPTIFHYSVLDIDLFGYRQRMPQRWKGRLEQLWRYPLLFFLHPGPAVDAHGHVGERTIPIPDRSHVRPFDFGVRTLTPYPDEPRFHPALLAEHKYGLPPYRDRPRQVVWRGLSTGVTYLDKPGASVKDVLLYCNTRAYLNHTDRGRAMAYFRQQQDNISDVGFTDFPSGRDWRRAWIRPTLSGVEAWYRHGRVWLDVDGASNSWEGLRWKLLAGGPVLKINSSNHHVQWYYHLLQDHVHLRVVDLDHDDIGGVARELFDDEALAQRMMEAAVRFSVERIHPRQAVAYMRHAMEHCWENQEEFAHRDWRIRRAG